MGKPLKIGIVGAGKISGSYLATLDGLAAVRFTAVTDLDQDRAKAFAEEGAAGGAGNGGRVAVAASVAELVARADVDAVLNLTVPAVHAEVALAALGAGKHVYGEKPLAANRLEAEAVLAAAREAGLRVACAPDTVLGTGTQTARKAVDDGLIGRPVAATAFMACAGHESWHPDPEFYYRPGGGPLLDMGPYYLSALVHLLGPVVKVTGASSRSRPVRTIGSGARAGQSFPVEVDTHITGVLEHADGALSTLIMSFDVTAARLPRIEVHGSDASLSVPDPNGFDGPVEINRGAGWGEARHGIEAASVSTVLAGLDVRGAAPVPIPIRAGMSIQAGAPETETVISSP